MVTVYAILRIVYNWIQIAKYERGGPERPHVSASSGEIGGAAACLCLINSVMGYIQEGGRMEREIINYPACKPGH